MTRPFSIKDALHRDPALSIVIDKDGNEYFLAVTHPKSVLEGYYISDQETGATSYYGYLNKDGYWYIMKAVTTGAEINYTYVKGSSGYNWANRASETYAVFNITFG